MENNIAQLRMRKNLKQADLARKLKVSRSFLNRVEKGTKKCSLYFAIKISEILDCGLDDIFLDKTLSNRSKERFDVKSAE